MDKKTPNSQPAEQIKLTLADCTYAMAESFHCIRTMDRETLLNAMIQLSLRYMNAICPKEMDTETRQVLAVHEIRDTLKSTENFLKGLPGDDLDESIGRNLHSPEPEQILQ